MGAVRYRWLEPHQYQETLATVMLPSYIALVFFFVSSTTALKASDYFSICHTSDPNYNQCLEKSLNELRHLLKKGDRDLRLVPMDPIVIPLVSTKEGKGPISVNSVFKNLTIEGTNNYKVNNVKADLSKGEIIINITTPTLYLTGLYEMNGRILVLPVKGRGLSRSTYNKVTMGTKIVVKPVVRDGVTYMNLEQFSCDIDVKTAKINMTGLFDGNKELSDAMHKLLTDNWEVIYVEIKPIVEETLRALLSDVASKIFKQFPASELFPK